MPLASTSLRRFDDGIPETDYDRWVAAYDTLRETELETIKAAAAALPTRPLFSVIVVTEGGDRAQPLLRSLEAQCYGEWEVLVLGDEEPETPLLDSELSERLRWINLRHVRPADPLAWALTMARGDFAILAEPSGALAPDALYEMAVAIGARPHTDLIYTDEDCVDGKGRRQWPFFKPDWNVELALTHHLVGPSAAYRRSVALDLCDPEAPIADGHDLALRFAARHGAAAIRHIPAVLYHHLLDGNSDGESSNQRWRGQAPSPAAVRRYLDHTGQTEVQLTGPEHESGFSRLSWPVPVPAPRVSVVLPTRDHADLVSRCIAGLLYRTGYANFEVLIVDNDSREGETFGLFERLTGSDPRVRILHYPGPFNYAAMNNRAVAAATGEIVLLLNNDVEVIESGWLRELVSHALRPDVGAVGARLLYGDGRVQHAGVVLGVGTHAGGPGVAGHFGHGAERDDTGYFGQLMLTREVSAVTGACLALRRDVYLQAGGLDEINLPISFNDVDLCLRIRTLGLRIIWTPFAELYHLESVSRGPDASPEQIDRAAREADYMRERWSDVLDHDPFYNPNFDRQDHRFRLRQGTAAPRSWAQARAAR
ncbi:glycosyltransferase family 2 protein [Acidisoma sp. 7E03]